MVEAAAHSARSAPPAHWVSVFATLPLDGAFRHGLKFGAAGVLAVFMTLWNKSADPTWSLFTVIVLSTAQYIGAISEKSLLRMAGTIIGGLAGFLLTAGLEQDPWIYLSLFALLVAFSTAMFGQSAYPYAFLLCGMTAVVICSNGLAQPETSWIPMLWRIHDIGVGILAVLLVQSLFWPHYAGREFLERLAGSVQSLRRMLSGGWDSADDRSFEQDVAQMRQLIRFGARESRYFRAKLGDYMEILGCARRIHNALRSLRVARRFTDFYRENFGEELRALEAALDSALAEVLSKKSTPASRRAALGAIDNGRSEIFRKLAAVRTDPHARSVELQDSLDFGLRALSLDEVRAEIEKLFALVDGLAGRGQKTAKKSEPFAVPGLPSTFWITNGIRSSVAAVAALVLFNWLGQPSSMVVLVAWVFCALLPIGPEGRGDRGSWTVVVFGALGMLVVCLALVAGTPAMASYSVTNIVLFTVLFLYGYLSFNIGGVTTVMNIVMMAVVGVLGLNAQQPVPFQAISNMFFSIVAGSIIATVCMRTMWPLLPQNELRDRLREFVSIQCGALGSDSLAPEKRFRLALIPGELLVRIRNLGCCPPAEKERLRALVDGLDRFSGNRIVDCDAGHLLEGADAAEFARLTKNLRNCCAEILTGISELFQQRKGAICPDPRALDAAAAEFAEWIKGCRLRLISSESGAVRIFGVTGRAARYIHAAGELREACKIAASLQPGRYMGDYSL